MEKYLLQIEFRYHAIPKSNSPYASDCYNKKIAIGIYDSVEDAIKEGNKALEVLKEKFKSNECFSKNGGEFFAEIETLHFEDLASAMEDVFNANERWLQKQEVIN
jgi:hypothetical protein